MFCHLTLCVNFLTMHVIIWRCQESLLTFLRNEGIELSVLLHIALERLPCPLIKIVLTTLAWPMTFICDLDLQSPASYGHNLPACKCSRSTVSRTDRRTEAIALPSAVMQSVIMQLVNILNYNNIVGASRTWWSRLSYVDSVMVMYLD